MAPNKKKKKPASNPARGFATTSTASKPRHDEIKEPKGGEQLGDMDAHTVSNTTDNGTRRDASSCREPEKASHELTPEELESQLENSSFQILVEDYGETTKKSVSRHVSKLRTEQRLLRSQVDSIPVRRWLSPKIMQIITDLLQIQDCTIGNLQVKSDSDKSSLPLSEDDLLIKLWTLKRLLPQLGFKEERTDLALRHLLTTMKKLGSQVESSGKDAIWGVISSGKDKIWGFDECLAWLALTSDPTDLPIYDFGEGLSHRPANHLRYGIPTPATTPTDSRPESPLGEVIPSQQPQTQDEDFSSSSESDLDGDLESEQLVIKYLELQSRLHQICPELTEIVTKRQRQARPKALVVHDKLDSTQKRRVDRLLTKMNKIKSDLLFDVDEANSRWTEIRINLAQEAVERKRLGVQIDKEEQRVVETKSSNVNLTNSDDDDDKDGILGGFFSSLPDTVKDPATGLTIMSTTSQEGNTVEIRDFGRWNGMNPRRILEEACKARDSASTVTYKLVSASAFSNRHVIEVRWSQMQEPIVTMPIDKLICESDARSVRIEMASISCPTEAQSEAYISTVALFHIFASSPKEEKAYLRLPSTWRDLWKELSSSKKDQEEANDRQILRELRDMIVENGQVSEHSEEESSGTTSKVPSEETFTTGLPKIHGSPSLLTPDDIRALWASKLSTPSYQHMLTPRMRLPIWNFKEHLLEAIGTNPVVIICGETGCGKSTQVPAFILEQELSSGRPCKIYCTEPRRISAISLARRVSEELGERKGDIGTVRSLVGFAIRLESNLTHQTRLVYATTGIVMRMLEGPDQLGDITHLVLDEVHERSIDSDFFLVVIRKLLKKRLDLKVVLMSATVNAERFSDYLGGAPILNVPGRTFPVDTRYLEDAVEVTNFIADLGSQPDEALDFEDGEEVRVSSGTTDLRGYSPKTLATLAKLDEYRIDYSLIVRLLEVIATSESYSPYSKAVLVFLPGIAEIRRLKDMLSGNSTFMKGWFIHTLHSTIATDEQEKAFLVPPRGIRKIVLATNIAETGVTIPDVTCVIDTGKHKEMRFDERRQLSRLIEAFISRANAKQRRGRAGRVQKGLCFHLFTKNRHDNLMSPEQTPEMLRLSLQDLVLRVKICKLGGIEETLSEALDPPTSKNIRRAVDSLIDVKALTTGEDLTALGRQLARLPLDVFLGKLVILGAIFGCLDAMLTIAAILSSKSPFSVPPGGATSKANLAHQAFRRGESDLLTVYNAYCAWRRVCGGSTAMSEQYFCQKNFMSAQTLSNIEDTKSQLTVSLIDAGFVTLNESEKASLNKVRYWSGKRSFVEVPNRYNSNNDNDLILNSVIAWGFYPKLLRREGKGWKNVGNNQAVSLHPTSINRGVERPPQWLSFYHIMQSSNKFYNAHETSPVESLAVALVCGEAELKMYSGVIVLDGNRIRFALDDWKAFLAVKALRFQIRQIMTQAFRNPGRVLSTQQQSWLDVWQMIFSEPKARP